MTHKGNVKVKLNNGYEIPIIGTGSHAYPDKWDEVKGWILTALKNGYRHIDTALGYCTEKFVGEAIRESGIPREEIFVTTKLPWDHHGRVKESFQESFDNLDIGYIDLYLIHWPQAVTYTERPEGQGHPMPRNPDGSVSVTTTVTFSDSWAEMEKLLKTGKVRSIGVSNFSIKNLEKLFETAKVVPVTNQVELHPYLAQNELRDYCTRKGITLTAYTPSGYAVVRADPLINSLAKKYKVTANQVILAWHISRGTIITPKSVGDERQKENITIPTISEEDLGKIWHLDRGQRICNGADPKFHQVWGWTYEQLGWEDYHPGNPETSKI